MLKVGSYLQGTGFNYGTLWIVWDVQREENESFYWYKVTVIYGGIGPIPYWSKEPHTLLMGRTNKLTGERYH